MFACYLFKKCVYILVKAKRQEVESLNEKHLITKLKKRSQKALDQLISSYSAYVYTIARNILGGAFTAEDAEEITSDVFFRIWQTADSLDEERTPRLRLPESPKDGTGQVSTEWKMASELWG